MSGPTSGDDPPASSTVPPPVRPGDRPLRVWRAFWRPLLLGAAYGLLSRYAFGRGGGLVLVLSTSFLLLVPAVMGFVVAWTLPVRSGPTAMGVSLLATTGLLLGSFVLHFEGGICIVMTLPFAFAMALAGASVGTGVRGWARGDARRPPGGPLLGMLLLPFVAGAIEARIDPEPDVRLVETQTTIAAPADVVWANVVRVPAIRETERETTFFHRIGFPRPLEATIDGAGVGAVRHATFERGVVFVETVTVWREREELAFTIEPRDVPPGAFDQHVSPGGPYFTTLEGRYRLEPLADGTVRLHLSSRSRLTTTARLLAAPWTDAAMRSIQEDILRIVKARCERGEVPR